MARKDQGMKSSFDYSDEYQQAINLLAVNLAVGLEVARVHVHKAQYLRALDVFNLLIANHPHNLLVKDEANACRDIVVRKAFHKISKSRTFLEQGGYQGGYIEAMQSVVYAQLYLLKTHNSLQLERSRLLHKRIMQEYIGVVSTFKPNRLEIISEEKAVDIKLEFQLDSLHSAELTVLSEEINKHQINALLANIEILTGLGYVPCAYQHLLAANNLSQGKYEKSVVYFTEEVAMYNARLNYNSLAMAEKIVCLTVSLHQDDASIDSTLQQNLIKILTKALMQNWHKIDRRSEESKLLLESNLINMLGKHLTAKGFGWFFCLYELHITNTVKFIRDLYNVMQNFQPLEKAPVIELADFTRKARFRHN